MFCLRTREKSKFMQALLVRTIEKHGASRKNLPRLSTKSYSHTLSLPRWSHSPPNYQYRLLQQQRRTPQPSFPLLHTRSLSSDSTFYSVIHVTERYFQIFHSATHLPWWAVILASTIALRSLLTLPLAVYQNKVMAKMELLQPTVKEYQEAVRHNMAAKCRKENLPYKEANRKIMKAIKQVTKQLYRQEGCNPYRIAILPWVQLPLWLLMSFTLRDMAGLYSDHLLPSADIRVSLASEGCLWFQDLTLPDPYLVLPIVMAATNLCNIELNSLQKQVPSTTRRILTNFLRILSVSMVFIGSHLPAAMTLYWSASSTYGLAQNILFKFPRVRRGLNIPRTPRESKTPFRDMWALVQEKTKAFLILQRQAAKKL